MKKVYKFVLLAVFAFSALPVCAQDAERSKAFALYEQGNYKEAAELLQKTVTANAVDRNAWFFLGMALARDGDEKRARAAFRKGDKTKENNVKEPFDSPARITYRERVRYTDQARQNLTSGTIKLAVEFRKDSTIGYIFAYEQLPDGLTESAIEAARKMKFEPAVKNGEKTTIIKTVEYSFSAG